MLFIVGSNSFFEEIVTMIFFIYVSHASYQLHSCFSFCHNFMAVDISSSIRSGYGLTLKRSS